MALDLSKQSIRSLVTFLIMFGVMQLVVLFQVYTSGYIQLSSQCDCECHKILQFRSSEAEAKVKTGVIVSARQRLSYSKDEMREHMDGIADDADEMREHLDEITDDANELGNEEDVINTLDAIDQYEPDTIDQSDNIHGIKYKEVPMYSALKLNPAVNDTPSRCAPGNHSHVILVYVYSATDNFKERTTIRNTWASVKHIEDKEFRVLFFIGKLSRGSSKAQYHRIIKESRIFGDVVQDLSYVDAYRNLTLKGISAMQWIAKYCPSPYRVLKVDDDTLVNPFELVRFLKGQSDITMSQMVGKVTSGTTPMRNESSKYYVSKQEYKPSSYPKYCQGYGYNFPPSMIPSILSKVKESKLIAMEDAYFTGIIREAAGFQLHHLEPHFLTAYVSFEKFLGRAATRRNLLLVGHVHDRRPAEIFWKMIEQREHERLNEDKHDK